MALKIIPIGLTRIFPAPCSPTSQGSVWSTPLAAFKCKYLENGNRIPIMISPKSYQLTIESRWSMHIRVALKIMIIIIGESLAVTFGFFLRNAWELTSVNLEPRFSGLEITSANSLVC